MSRAVDQQNHFFSMKISAAKIGVSVRHFRRLSEYAGVTPHVFGKDGGGNLKFFFDQKQLNQIQRYRNSRSGTYS